MEQQKTRPGDLWTLGRHRLLCGDATREEDVARVLDGSDSVVMASDPPYCSGGFQEHSRAGGTQIHKGKNAGIAFDNLSTRGYVAMMRRALQPVRPCAAYVFTDWRMWSWLHDAVESCGLPVRSMLVWDKGYPGLGGLWRAQHEIVLFAARSSKRAKSKAGRSNVLAFPRTGKASGHPTQKPVALFEALLATDDASERTGAVVYDPFLGSGTTLLAAERLGRAFVGLEIEPHYCDVAVHRWETLTGETAMCEGRKRAA